MQAMLFRSIVVLLAGCFANADFRFLNCTSSGPTTITIPADPTIVVPTSDLSSCAGILGDRMVLLDNLTQPVGQGTVVSFNGFCDTQRLDVRTASSVLLSIFYSGGDGTLLGECSPSPPTKYSCVSPSLGSLDCTDSWTCFTGICEVARLGVNTQPFTTSLPATLIASSTPGPSSNTGTQSSSNTTVSGTGEQPTAAIDGDTSSTNHKNESSSSQKSVIAAAVLGVICLCLGAGITILVWHRRRRTEKTTHVTSDLPPTEQYSRRSVVAPVLTSGTLGHRPVPFLATQASPSATTSLKTPGTFSRGVREEVRDAVPERLVSPGPRRSNVASWQTDLLPPSYVHDLRVG